jgi:hypothetical protein
MTAIRGREHIMRLVRIGLVTAVTVAALESTAFAQSDIAPKTAVSFVGGAGATGSATGVALGGSWLFDVNDRASVEAQGTYPDRGRGTDAVSVSGSRLVNLLSARVRIVPYAAVGGGVSFGAGLEGDLAHEARAGGPWPSLSFSCRGRAAGSGCCAT